MLNTFKSVIRNKANRIYFIVLLILFIIICFYSNLDSIIYDYYNSKIESESITEISKTITIEDVIDLSEEDINELKQIKHVVDVQTKKMETSILGTINIYEISVDDWKNVNSVTKTLDKIGIRSTRIAQGGYFDNLFNNYEKIQLVLNIIGIFIFIVFSLLVIICWRNILKNEEKNINILRIIGYRNSKINTIKFTVLIVFSLIIFFLSFIITNGCLTILV